MSNDTIMSVRGGPMRRAFSSDVTTAGTTFARILNATTRPSGTGIIDFGDGVDNGPTPNGLELRPYGTAASATFILAVYSWRRVLADPNVAGSVDSYTSSIVAAVTGTLSSASSGVDGTTVAAGNAFAASYNVSTTAFYSGNPNVGWEAIANGTVSATCSGALRVDISGASLIQIAMRLNASATTLNCLWAAI